MDCRYFFEASTSYSKFNLVPGKVCINSFSYNDAWT